MAKKTLVSPRGTAQYPHLDPKRPDDKFKKEGQWHVKLTCDLDDPKAKEIIKAIDECAAASLKAAEAMHAAALKKETDKAKVKKLKAQEVKMCADMPYSVDEEENTVTFSFKKLASGEKKDGTKWKGSLPLYDAKGNPIVKPVKIGGNSVLKVSFQDFEPFNPSNKGTAGFFTYKLGAGVTLRMEGVQVLELREWTRDAKSMGFEEEEGYDGSADDTDATSDTDDDSTETAGDDVSPEPNADATDDDF